jgi:hypothetical protein
VAFNFDFAFNVDKLTVLESAVLLAYKHNIVTDALLRMRKREASTRKIAMHEINTLFVLTALFVISFSFI